MSTRLKNAFNEDLTLTREQEACLNYNGDKMLMVKGVAGAGKSLIIQALAKKMIDSSSNDKVAIFTFSNTLNSATKEFLKVNGSEDGNITVVTVHSYLSQVCKAMKLPYSKIPTDPLYSKLKKESLFEAIDDQKSKKGQHRLYNADYKYLIDEFDWMKDMNISTQDRDIYLSIPRKGRGTSVRVTNTDRQILFDLYESYCNIRKEKKQGDWSDMALHVTHNIDKIPESKKFDHILIDEAQDLSLAQMIAITSLFTKDMVVAMDMNQRIFDKQWTLKQLGIESTTKRLTKSMRTTRQIDSLAESVRSHNEDTLEEDDKTIRAIPEKDGPLPKIVHLESLSAEKKYITELIKAWLDQSSKISIGVIASKKESIELYASWMTDAGIEHEIVRKDSEFSMAKPGVKIVNVYNTKGLEFTRVIIPQFVEGHYPYRFWTADAETMQQYIAKSRNLVYVAMSRAQYSLTITYSGSNGSRFLGEMDPTLYEAEGLPITYYSANYQSGSTSSSKGKTSDPPPFAKKSEEPIGNSLKEYFEDKGLEVVDLRKSGGCLWVVGDAKSIGKYVKEAGKLYGAFGSYAKGSKIGKRVGWWTKCKN